MKHNSETVNRQFKNFCSFVAIENCLEPHMAKNIVRWHMSQKKTQPKKRTVWCNPKTGLPLTQAEWTGPALALAEKVKNGTREGLYSIEEQERFQTGAIGYMFYGVLLDLTCPDKITETFINQDDF